jgi:hypothetical protein
VITARSEMTTPDPATSNGPRHRSPDARVDGRWPGWTVTGACRQLLGWSYEAGLTVLHVADLMLAQRRPAGDE